jgi:very-short-patch-repair endonuclease
MISEQLHAAIDAAFAEAVKEATANAQKMRDAAEALLLKAREERAKIDESRAAREEAMAPLRKEIADFKAQVKRLIQERDREKHALEQRDRTINKMGATIRELKMLPAE